MSLHFASSHYGPSHHLSSHYGRLVPDDQVHPPGMGRVGVRRWIQEEDDFLMAIIMAFLRIKDD